MPGNESSVGAVSAVKAADSTTEITTTERAQRAKAFGRLSNMHVKEPVLEEVDTDTRSRFRPWGSFGAWRNAGSAILTGDGIAPISRKTDTCADITRKVGAIGNRVIMGHDTHVRLILPRTMAAFTQFGKAGYQLPKWYSSDLFKGVLMPTQAMTIGITSIHAAKRAYDIGHEVAADIARHGQREKLQTLLKDFNPISYQFRSPATGRLYNSESKRAQMSELMNSANRWHATEGGNIWRNKSQRALDVLAKVKDLGAFLPANVISPAVGIGAIAGSTLAVAASGVGCVGHGVSAINNFAKMGVQMSAIANIEAERQKLKEKVSPFNLAEAKVIEAPVNHLLLAATNRMIQERTYASRLLGAMGAGFVISAGSQIGGLAVGGIGYIPSLIISGVALTIANASGMAFSAFHSRTLSHRRAENTVIYNQYKQHLGLMNAEARTKFFQSLDNKHKIGLIERYVLDTLRDGKAAEAQAVYDFLLGCGISENTIKSMILQPIDKAMGTLQTQMYSARTKFISKNMRQLPKVVGYVSGVSYLARFVKDKRAEALTRKLETALPAPL